VSREVDLYFERFADLTLLSTFDLGFRDDIEVMSSLIRPKKITIIGSDGIAYPFLLKPQDDLRKDARLMDFNGMINKLLKNDSASRRRNLCEFFFYTSFLVLTCLLL